MPMERILMGYKRIVIKDSTVNAICYGADLMIPGVLRFDNDINLGSIYLLIILSIYFFFYLYISWLFYKYLLKLS